MDNETLLATFAILGGWQPPARPREAALELTADGWQVWDGKSDKPLPVHCDIAWEIAEKDASGSGAVAMEQTRKLCGELRIAAKRPHVGRARRAQLEEIVQDLRDGMARVRSGSFREFGLADGVSPSANQPQTNAPKET